jgi:short-subunit dehydrogenase
VTRAKPGSGHTALVTGASSGIGEALAHHISFAGFDLVLVARSAGKQKALANTLHVGDGARVRVQPADLSAPGAAAKLAAALKRDRRPVDVLVKNAGVLEHGDFVAMQPTRRRELIDLSVVVLTESLFEERKGSGVMVTASCRGSTASSMLERAQAGSAELGALPGLVVGTAEEVTAEGLRACLRGEVIRVPGVVNRAASVAGRSTPRWLLRSLTGAVVRRLKSE